MISCRDLTGYKITVKGRRGDNKLVVELEIACCEAIIELVAKLENVLTAELKKLHAKLGKTSGEAR